MNHDAATTTDAVQMLTEWRDRALAAEAKRARAEAAVGRVERYLDAVEAHCSASRLDVPSWVTSVRNALGGSRDDSCPGPHADATVVDAR
jgi:hypothetical protein